MLVKTEGGWFTMPKHKGFSFCWVCLGWSLLSLCQPNEGGRGRIFVAMAITTICGCGFVFQVIAMVAESLHTCLQMGSSEWIPLVACTALSLLNVIILVHKSFHLPSLFSPSCGRGNEEAVVWAFGCWLGTAHNAVLLQSWKFAILTSPVIVKNCFLFKCSILQIRLVPVWIFSTLYLKLPMFAPHKWST